MFKEFKAVALRDNMADMAVGIFIGVAFGTIVKSFVDDLLKPLKGLKWERWTFLIVASP